MLRALFSEQMVHAKRWGSHGSRLHPNAEKWCGCQNVEEENPLSLIEGLSGGSPLPLSLSAGIGLRPFSDNELEIKDVSRHMWALRFKKFKFKSLLESKGILTHLWESLGQTYFWSIFLEKVFFSEGPVLASLHCESHQITLSRHEQPPRPGCWSEDHHFSSNYHFSHIFK